MPESNFFVNSRIEVNQLPDVEKLDFISIERSYAKILYISNLFIFAFFLALLIIFVILYLGILSWLSYALLILWMMLLIFSLWFASASVDRKSYVLRQKDISYRTGVFFRDWITIPFSRVQHCELSRGILERSFGLAQLHVYTAGGSSSDISIPGLRDDVAMQMKEFVIAKIKDIDEEE